MSHLYLMAHQDDDLLFVNPDLEDSIRAGRRVRTIFLTAAASSPTPPTAPNLPSWYAREDGVAKAYRAMADVAQQADDWTCQVQTYLTNKAVRVCTLNTQPLVSVVFMRLPDGGSDPAHQPGMAALWAGSVPQLATFTRPEVPVTPSSTYTRSELMQVLAALIADFAPDLIGTQDSTLAYGDDHADHIAGAQFALEAAHTYTRPHDLWMYRDYNLSIWWGSVPAAEVPNLSQGQHDEKLRIMEIYGGPLPANDPWQAFCWRRYAISRLSGGTGHLVGPGGQCIDVGNNPGDGTPAGLVPCSAAATRWMVNASGQIVDADTFIGLGQLPSAARASVKRGPREMAVAEKPSRSPRRLPAVSILKCLAVDANGSVRVSACASSPAQTWSVMSNGQIRGAGATCLSVAADGVSVQALSCQAERVGDKLEPLISQRWVQQMGDPAAWSSGAQFSDADLGDPAAYAGSFRMGDVNGDGYADACIRLGDGVHCALNTRAGAFAQHSLYSAGTDFSDAAGWQPDAYGSTIQLADVNGDGKADVCGRRSDGIVCATANAAGTGFENAGLWSSGTNFSDADGWNLGAAYYGSIRLADVNGDGYADVCGRSPSGIVCALNNKAGAFGAASLWSTDFADPGWQGASYGSTIQFGDINGDGKADACGRGPAGIRCAIANATGTGFTDAHQWSLRNDFSDADGWGASPGLYGSIRLADVNGDGYADACGRSSGGIVCAVSNRGGFDAALPLMPQGYTDGSGWSATIYGATIQFGDLDHDRRHDVCGRGPTGLVCAKAP